MYWELQPLIPLNCVSKAEWVQNVLLMPPPLKYLISIQPICWILLGNTNVELQSIEPCSDSIYRHTHTSAVPTLHTVGVKIIEIIISLSLVFFASYTCLPGYKMSEGVTHGKQQPNRAIIFSMKSHECIVTCVIYSRNFYEQALIPPIII